MAITRGFWSYVHADDRAEGGRIASLARDVVAQFGLLTGEEIELFLDQDDLEWGDHWRSKIDQSLADIAFFIPVITPRYFQSAQCRGELQYFARQASALGVEELVMPLLYIDFAGFREDPPSDSLIGLVRDFQWENWTELRFAEAASGEYRSAVARLAARLVEGNKAAERADVAAAAEAIEADATGDEDEPPGFMDRMAAMEEAIPQWQETLLAINEQITTIGELMQSATADIEAANKRGGATFAARLAVARTLAKRLEDPSQNVLNLSTEFTNGLHSVDSGIRAMIEKAPAAVEAPEDEFGIEQACEFFEVVRSLAEQMRTALGSVQTMVDAVRPIEASSRDLRPSLRTLRQGLTLMIEGQGVVQGWVEMIDQSPIDCGGASGQVTAQ